jgi:hypothetical protein
MPDPEHARDSVLEPVPGSVHEAFVHFHRYITPTEAEFEGGRARRAEILSALRASFGVTRFFPVGSFSNGTGVRGFSDADYFATIPGEYASDNSDSMLQAVAYALSVRFPEVAVAVRTPAVLLPFGNDPSGWVEVFPVRFMEQAPGQYLVYQIADGRGGWKPSMPDAHNAYITSVDRRLKNMVRPLIRFIKAWKYYRSVPVSSFYLELWVTAYAANEAAIVYGLDVKNILLRLANEGLAPLADPLGVTGDIPPCTDESKHADALFRLKTSLSIAESAAEAESAGDIEEAIQRWDVLYAGAFRSARV